MFESQKFQTGLTISVQMGMICPIYRVKVGHWQEKHLQGTYYL